MRGPRTPPVIVLFFAFLTATALAAKLPGEKAKWIRVDTEHFSIYSNTSSRRASSFGRNLERLRG